MTVRVHTIAPVRAKFKVIFLCGPKVIWGYIFGADPFPAGELCVWKIQELMLDLLSPITVLFGWQNGLFSGSSVTPTVVTFFLDNGPMGYHY